jgi:aryl-alcohol dehydrogenase-like predicted oxidoreductase
MKRILLKNTELSLSNICLGTANFKERLDRKSAFNLLDYYVDMGGNFIDTANVYGRWLPETENSSEQFLGEWFQQSDSRSKICLATKGGHPNLQTGENRVNKTNLSWELDNSLSTMRIETIDFYWFHRDNINLPIDEVIAIGEDFVKQGKVRYYGASNFTLPRMQQAMEWRKNHEDRGFIALSNQWSLAYPNPEYKLNGDQTLEGVDATYYRWIRETNLPLIPYSATANGFFAKASAKTLSPALEQAYGNSRNRTLQKILVSLAEDYHTTPFVLSLAVLLHQDFQVIPVTSASSKIQLEETLKASEFRLIDHDVAILNRFL